MARVYYLLMLVALVVWTNPTLLPFTSEQYRKDEFDLHYGPWGIVLGGSHGLGLEWSYALAERGVNVIMVGRNQTELKLAKDAIEKAIPWTQYRTITLELGNIDEWKRIAFELARELEIGIVVHNAAYSPVGPFVSFSAELHEQAVDINVRSVMIAAAAFLPPMVKRQKGGFIIMSSADGEACSPYVSNYAGTKAYNTRFAETLWYEMLPHNVSVLGVVAGLTTTRTLDGVLNPSKRIWWLESSPFEVVHEALRALGKGQPIVITGLGTKLITWFRWLLPRSVGCHLLGAFKDVVKTEEELRKFAHQTYKK